MSGFSLGKSPDDGVSMIDSVDMEEEGEGVATGRETSQMETGYKPVNNSTPMLGTKGKSTEDSQKEGTTDSGQKDDDVTTPRPNSAAVPKADVPNSEVETVVSSSLVESLGIISGAVIALKHSKSEPQQWNKLSQTIQVRVALFFNFFG